MSSTTSKGEVELFESIAESEEAIVVFT